ncbi:hypothetical protein P7M41_26610, partial [Vibrio parahaemolyticus]|nr:hypothetical protein [Vibrio parahaemolyticus]
TWLILKETSIQTVLFVKTTQKLFCTSFGIAYTPKHFGKTSADLSLTIFIKTLPYCGRMSYFAFIEVKAKKICTSL